MLEKVASSRDIVSRLGVSAHGLLTEFMYELFDYVLHPTMRLLLNRQGFQAELLAPEPSGTIAAATEMLSSIGKLTVKALRLPNLRGTSPESFHPLSEKFQTVPCPETIPAWYVTEQCTGKRWWRRSVKGMERLAGGVL